MERYLAPSVATKVKLLEKKKINHLTEKKKISVKKTIQNFK
jgi:hypothetical protein